MSMTREEKKHWQGVGYHIAIGVMTAAWVVVVASMVLAYLISGTGWVHPTDYCDRSTWDRCGMKVLTDAKTGQQYLETPGGGIIARATK